MQAKIPALPRRRKAPVILLCAVFTLLLSALPITGASAASHHRPARISGSRAFTLPPASRCLSGGSLKLRWNRLRRVRWSRGLVRVGGRRFATIAHWTRVVTLTGLPSGRFALSIVGVTRDGRRATASRVFHSCSSHNPRPEHKERVPAPPTPSPPGTPSPPPPSPASSPEPGSYSVHNSGSYAYGFSFYVSPDGSHIEDVSGAPGLECSPGGYHFSEQFYIPSIAIAADGSFSGTGTETGVESGSPAALTFTFSGHFIEGKFSGALRENVSYDNGTAYSCDSGTVTWTATRDNQGTQAPVAHEPGSYSVHNSGSYAYGFSFYVSPDGSHIEDVSGAPGLECSPGGYHFSEQFYIPSIAIAPDGSFSGTKTETGVRGGSPATLTFTFSGRFHGYDAAGRVRAAGMLHEEVSYGDGTTYACSSKTVTWSATRDTQPSQAASPLKPGAYNVHNAGSYDYGFTFSVAPSGSQLLDVSGDPGLECSPGGYHFSEQFYIPSIAIAPDGSFSGTSTESGQVFGHPATLTYTFSGHFHGYDSSARARAAGVLQEEVTYANGATYTCSSNSVPWSATSS